MRATIRLMIAMLGLGALTAAAVPFKRSLIAADADWLAHLDLEALKRTEVGAFIDREMRTPEADRNLEACKALLAIDPRDELTSLAAYGTGTERVILMEGRFDKGRMEQALRANAGYQELKYQGGTIHSWTEARGAAPGGPAAARKYGVIMTDRLVAASDTESGAKKALDVFNGRVLALAASSTLVSMIPREPVPFFAVGRDLALSDMREAGNALSQPGARPAAEKSVVIKAGERTGQFFCEAVIATKDEQEAVQLQAAIQGLLALTAIGQQADSKVASLLRSIVCVGEGDHIRLSFRCPAGELVQILQEQKLKKTAPKPPGGI